MSDTRLSEEPALLVHITYRNKAGGSFWHENTGIWNIVRVLVVQIHVCGTIPQIRYVLDPSAKGGDRPARPAERTSEPVLGRYPHCDALIRPKDQ